MKALKIIRPELHELTRLQSAELLPGIRFELKSIGGRQAEDRSGMCVKHWLPEIIEIAGVRPKYQS